MVSGIGARPPWRIGSANPWGCQVNSWTAKAVSRKKTGKADRQKKKKRRRQRKAQAARESARPGQGSGGKLRGAHKTITRGPTGAPARNRRTQQRPTRPEDHSGGDQTGPPGGGTRDHSTEPTRRGAADTGPPARCESEVVIANAPRRTMATESRRRAVSRPLRHRARFGAARRGLLSGGERVVELAPGLNCRFVFFAGDVGIA